MGRYQRATPVIHAHSVTPLASSNQPNCQTRHQPSHQHQMCSSTPPPSPSASQFSSPILPSGSLPYTTVNIPQHLSSTASLLRSLQAPIFGTLPSRTCVHTFSDPSLPVLTYSDPSLHLFSSSPSLLSFLTPPLSPSVHRLARSTVGSSNVPRWPALTPSGRRATAAPAVRTTRARRLPTGPRQRPVTSLRRPRPWPALLTGELCRPTVQTVGVR